MYFKTFKLEVLWCQPEPVEGGLKEAHRLRQAQPDTPNESNFLSLEKCLIFILLSTHLTLYSNKTLVISEKEKAVYI